MARQYTKERMIELAQEAADQYKRPCMVYPHPLCGFVYNTDKKNVARAIANKDERVTVVYPK